MIQRNNVFNILIQIESQKYQIQFQDKYHYLRNIEYKQQSQL